MARSPSRTPSFIALGLVAAALVVSAAGGFSDGSVLGAALALAAVIPAGYGMWQGVQEKTQGGLALALGAFFIALGVAAILVILKVVALF